MSSFCNLMVLFEPYAISPSELHGCFVVGLSFGLVFIHTKYESNRWASGKVNTEISFFAFGFFWVFFFFNQIRLKLKTHNNPQHITFFFSLMVQYCRKVAVSK